MAEMGAGQLRGPDMDKTSFEDLARMVEQDYVVNARRSMRRLKASLSALRPVFGGALARDITLDRLNAYVADRFQAKKAPATVKNELIALHRAFRLAARSGKAICPPFPVLSLHNVRSGFFEREDFLAVRGRLSEPVQAVATFAYLTGWRTPSEILPLQWRQVDFAAGTLRLDPGTTKNGEGRVFPFAVLPELADLIQRQRAYTDTIQREKGSIIPWVFHRKGTPIRRSFYREWHAA
jgi:integrase